MSAEEVTASKTFFFFVTATCCWPAVEREELPPKFRQHDGDIYGAGDKVLYCGSDESARKLFTITLFQKVVQQQFGHEVNKASDTVQ